MRKVTAAVLGVLLGVLLLPLQASADGAAIPWGRLHGATAGTWVEYVVRVGDVPVGPFIRFLALGPDPASGGTWVELWISQRPGSATQAFRLLVPPDGSAPREVVARILGGESRQLALEAQAPPLPAPAPALETGGEEAVATAAGVFRARRIETRGADRWLSRAWWAAEVPLFGLVRMDLASGAGWELHAFGTDGLGVVAPPP